MPEACVRFRGLARLIGVTRPTADKRFVEAVRIATSTDIYAEERIPSESRSV
ncbi:hypothetical protein KIN20_025064 [Parelaphostrongylus tenuis]|uniref:Uncharacterized protein n=1 Tax=Parelaphostrongylus tenuis TaxID=148309 RepID=A0AAD5MUL6_PARTN|nr:hypothetical protein KIN20_025064 [Parelaphostrongylus tenuis]